MSIRIRKIFEDDQQQQPSQGTQVNFDEIKKKIHDSIVDLITQNLPKIITDNIKDYANNPAYKQSIQTWNTFKASKDKTGDESIDAFKNYVNSVVEGMNTVIKQQQNPSQAPSQQPTQQPSQQPSQAPSQQPSQQPTQQTSESFTANLAKSDFKNILKENLERKLKQDFLNENY